MKIKQLIPILSVLCGAAVLGGCARTPEDSLVKQKGKASMEHYQEGTPLTEASSEADGSSDTITGQESASTKDREQTEGDTQADDNRLRQTLGAPEHYTNEVTDETGKLKIITDAQVDIPNASKVSAISVSQHPFDQALIDRITDAFFSEAKIYDADSFYQTSKDDWQKILEELNGYVASGNLDPYGWGTDENGNLIFDIYAEIELVRQNYENTDDGEIEYREVHPQFGLEHIDDKTGETWTNDSLFLGIAILPDDTRFRYKLKSYPSMPMDVQIQKLHEENAGDSASWMWSECQDLYTSAPAAPDETKLKQGLKRSLTDAQKLADEKVAQLGLSDEFSLGSWEYGTLWKRPENNGFQNNTPYMGGYILHYVRKPNNIPVTYTTTLGGSYEDMDSDMETWSYEVLNFYITDEGIDQVDFYNLYDIGEVKTENLNLMPFDEIIKIYEKMMLIQNADVLNYEKNRTYRIDRISFGYTRIYEPQSDSTTGLLVPVWDFFGQFECDTEDGSQVLHSVNAMQYQSYLTINAVDGSIIDRSLGY